jgi:hypothetical protein
MTNGAVRAARAAAVVSCAMAVLAGCMVRQAAPLAGDMIPGPGGEGGPMVAADAGGAAGEPVEWRALAMLAGRERERMAGREPDPDGPEADQGEEDEEPGPKRIPNWRPQEPWTARDGGPDFGFEAVPGTGWVPPDAGMAVGPNHIVAIVNGQVAFFDKQGNNTFRQNLAGASGFWVSLGAAGLVFDPEAHYDPFHDRFWLAACEQTGGAGYFNIAVSATANPNGAWHRYRIDVTGAGGPDADSINMAIAPNAVYLTGDFDSGGAHTLVYVLPVTPLLSGQPASGARWTTLAGIKGIGLAGRWDTSGGAQLMAYGPTSSAGSSSITVHAIQNPLTAPTLVSTSIAVPQYLPPGRPVQPGTAVTADIFGARFWSCVQRNGSLWATHHVSDPGTGRTVVRWYEFAMGSWPASGQPALRQWGQIDSGAGTYTFCPSIGVDSAGNAAITYVRSSAAQFITICRAVRRAGDALGTTRPVRVVRASTTSFTLMDRWGDYSTTVPDPAEPCTFWGHHQWTTSPSDWRTWIARYDARPRADMDRNCQLNINDFIAFINLFGAGDPAADMDESGQLNVLDFIAFINAFGTGE